MDEVPVKPGPYHVPVLSISRFRVDPQAVPDFQARADRAVEFFAGCDGCLSADLLRNLDEPGLWSIVTRWVNVGAYRRAFNGYDAKMVLIPLLSEAIDEPSAYAAPAEVGENRPRGAIT